MPPEYRARIEAARPQLAAMALQQYGLEIKSGPFGIDSRPALVGAKFAEAQGAGDSYHRAVFKAYWQQAHDIGDLQVLADLAAQVGLDRDGFLHALTNSIYDQQVTADVQQAAAYGLSGVPAVVINQRYLVMGAQPYPVLEDAVRQAQNDS